MSTKSTKQGKKLSVPRTMAEIQAAYQQLCANAGQVQYQLKVQSKELEKLNAQLEAVNKEAFARQQLDAAAPKDNAMQAEAGV
jgi:rRNA maturation endonuclease Nob1